MSRTRRRPHLTDDPRAARKLRQKSGIDLLHEEPWFGFNVADKMPNKGDVDPAGNPFNGLGRLKVADNAVGPNELDNQVLDTKHYVIISGDRRLTPGVKFALGDAIGSLDVSLLGGGGAGHLIDKDLIPGIGTLNGSLGFSQLTGNATKGQLPGSIVYGNSRGQLSYADLIDKPHLSRFLTANDIENKANKGWVQDYVRKYVTKHVKPTARR